MGFYFYFIYMESILMKIVQEIPFLLQKLLIMDTCTYWFFFIHLSDLEKNWNLSIKMFDSTPNSQHNLNKAKKMKKQKNLNIAPKDVKNKWADNENSFFKWKKKTSSHLLRSYYNVNRPHPLPKKTLLFPLSNNLYF